MKATTVFLAALLTLAIVLPAAAEVVTLSDGTVLQGKILQGDEKGLRMQRFDTGGVVFLPWSFLVERDRVRIRKDRGLDIGELDIFQIPGVRIELTNRTIYEGVIASDEGDRIVMHTAQSKIPIPKNQIVRRESVTVNAVEVYPPQKLYDDRRAEKAPIDADSHFELAKFSIQIELYEKAIEHFGKVQELDPEYKPDFIQARLAECQTMVAEKGFADLFNSITRLLYSNKFREALDKIAALEEIEELDAVWKEKLKAKKEEAETKRKSFFIRSIASQLPRYIRSVAEAVGKDKNMSWQDGRRYARRDFSRDLRAKLMARFEIDEKELKSFIADIKSYHQIKVSYGAFTWFAPGERPPKFKKVQSRQSSNQRGRSSRNNNKNQQKAKQLPKQDDLWARTKSKQRANYLHAMWAERSPEVHVMRVDRRPCSACAGRGTTKSTGEGGIVETRCWRCRGIGSDKVLVYRIGPGDGQGNVAAEKPADSAGGLTPAQRLRQKLLERKKAREQQGGGSSKGGDSRRGFGRSGGRTR